jgi:hypothetical protein
MNRMIVQRGEISSFLDRSLSQNNNSSHNKEDITNVTKVAVRKSTLMQITRAKAASSYHWTKRQDYHINVNNFLTKIFRKTRRLTCTKKIGFRLILYG